MKTTSSKLILAVLILLSSTTFAQLTIDGQFKTRFQMLHGYKSPVAKETPATFGADQRSRLIFGYTSEKYSANFTLQDARVWGSDDFYNATGNQRNSYGLGIYEAWVELKLGQNSALKVGRQEWKYNGSRLISHRDWWTTGLSYDGLLYKMHNKESGLFIDLGLSYNNDMNPGTGEYINAFPDRLKTVNFLNIKKAVNEKFDASFNFIFSGKQDAANANILYMKATEGVILNYNNGKKATDGVFGGLSAYFQHGETALSTTGHQKSSAYMLDVNLGFRAMEKKLEISAGVEMLSGHDATNTDSLYNTINHTFDLLNGGRHPYYGGNLDYFVMPAHMKNAGMMDPYLKLNYKTSEKGNFGLGIWLPMLANDLYTSRMDDNGDKILYEKGLGTGIDLSYKHKFSKEVMLMIGGSFFMMSDSFKEMKSMVTYDANNSITDDKAGQQYFVYTMLIVKPSFFSSEKK
ncbi:MAG: alginate export family protein [Bacteroidales bacterium]|nr:alginate export family protein [Bacteroidales bacterium]